MKYSGIARDCGSVLKIVGAGSAFLFAGASTAFAAGIQVIPLLRNYQMQHIIQIIYPPLLIKLPER